MYSTNGLWATLRGVVPNSTLSHIRLIRRVLQQNKEVRFDLFVTKERVDQTLSSLKRFMRHWLFYFRLHSQERLQFRRQSGNAQPETTASSKVAAPSTVSNQHPRCRRQYLRLATWNINSFKGKRHDVEMMCSEWKVDVLALQEVGRGTSAWQLKLSGYKCVEVASQSDEPGARGLALAFSKSLQGWEIGTRCSNWVFVRLFGGALTCPVIVCCIYLPTTAACRRNNTTQRRMLKECGKEVQNLVRRHPAEPLVIMGDLNCKRQWLNRQISKWGDCGMVALVPQGNPRTLIRQGVRYSAIDHMLVNGMQIPTNDCKARVIRDWDGSDHLPLFAKIPLTFQQRDNGNQWQPVRGKRFVARNIQRCPASVVSEIRDDNRWTPLAQLCDPLPAPEALATEFTEVSRKVAEGHEDLVRDPRPPSNNLSRVQRYPPYCSKKSKRLIERRRCKFRQLMSAPTPQKPQIERQYKDLAKEARASAKQDRAVFWHRSVLKGARCLVRNDAKAYWRFIKSVSGQGRAGSSMLTQPVKNARGSLEVDPEKIAKTWADHYGALMQDSTGHSKDANHWKVPARGLQLRPPIDPENQRLNHRPTWREICLVLHGMKNHKAPGVDGIPPEWFKLAQDALDDEERIGRQRRVARPQSEMGKALYNLILSMWEHERHPRQWGKAKMVSVPKKGDKTIVDNYRGISLIAIGVKILSTIIIRRVTDALEATNFFRREQAGFRSREEATAQSITLYEIVMRRQYVGHSTTAVFIDMQKAFDTVPHEALFEKVRRAGITGKVLRIIKNIYNSSKVQVDGPAQSYTSDIERGVRQGCPMSPILFDIFINDLLIGTERYGVRVPGVPRLHLDKVPGLMFADDLVCLSPNRSRMRSLLRHVVNWVDTWEMKINVRKCGTMVFFGSDQRNAAAQFHIKGEPVPIVEEYCYLGFMFNRTLDRKHTADHRIAVAKRRLQSLTPFLGSNKIPFSVRDIALRGLVISTLLYGCELWGMSLERLKPADALIDKAVRHMIRTKTDSKAVTTRALRRELNLPPASAMAAARRARGWAKFHTLRTIISTLVEHKRIQGVAKRAWAKQTQQWLKAYIFTRDENAYTQWCMNGANPQELSRRVQEITWRTPPSRLSTPEIEWHSYKATRGWNKVKHLFPELNHGIICLIKMRTGFFWSLRKHIARGLMVPNNEWKRKCPFCKRYSFDHQSESRAHLLLECRAWAQQRTRYLGAMVQDAIRLARQCRPQMGTAGVMDLAKCYLLGGEGPDDSSLDEWMPNVPRLRRIILDSEDDTQVAELDTGYLQDDDTVRMPDLWTSCGCLRVIRFLSDVTLLRRRRLDELFPEGMAYRPRGPLMGVRPNG